MRKFKLIITLAMLALGVSAFAQNVKVSGIVSDQDGEPVPGATVLIQGTLNGTTTGADGSYTISAPASAILEFRSVGYQTVTIPVNGRFSYHRQE